MIRVNGRWRRRLGLAVNAGLRVAIVGFAIEAALAGADPRFDNKGIAVRNLVFAGVAVTLAVPLLHLIRGRRHHRYPLVADTLVLSILALDMAANSLNLYALPWRFDLIPHTYSPLAGVLVLADLGVGRATRTLAVLAAAVLFELQEVAGDLYFGTSNVGGAWDTAGDLAGAVTGAVLIPWAWQRWRQPGDG
ncbi:MAG TPA: hypothetical protein VLA59_02380 [Patescibacteria group bacterium]|nr:hypothetical protein [Patescibacteria group bacterium]